MKTRLTATVAAIVMAFALAAPLPQVQAHDPGAGNTCPALHDYKLKFCAKRITDDHHTLTNRDDWYKVQFDYRYRYDWSYAPDPFNCGALNGVGTWHKWGSDGEIHIAGNDTGVWKCASGGTGNYHTHAVYGAHYTRGFYASPVPIYNGAYVCKNGNACAAGSGNFDLSAEVDDGAHTVCFTGEFKHDNVAFGETSGKWHTTVSFNCVAE